MTNEKRQERHEIARIWEDMPKQVEESYQYFLRGISAPKVAKLQNVTLRTVQRWKAVYQFEQRAAIPTPDILTIEQRALKMANAGLSYSEIGRKLGRCKATIYNYVKQEKAKAKAKPPAAAPGHLYQSLFDYLNETFDILPLQSEMDEIIRLSKEIYDNEILDN